ncbi:MAG: hypothetical protein II695_11385 [Oscillospiraceae bacterium]|nr:hypothetical protein [Oscillospiraceae bacterium]
MIADGAAFGSEIDRITKMQPFSNIRLCLPESFEWLILRSGIVSTADMKLLDDPSEYIESAEYFSWENFFEKYLIGITVGTPFKYDKSEINDIYLIPANSKKILDEIISNE